MPERTPKQHSRCIGATATHGGLGGRVPGDRKAIAFTVASARSLMDRASDYGSEGWKFESSRARQLLTISFQLATDDLRFFFDVLAMIAAR